MFHCLKKKNKDRNFQPTWDYSHCSYLDMTRWRFPKINVVKETYTYFLKERGKKSFVNVLYFKENNQEESQ